MDSDTFDIVLKWFDNYAESFTTDKTLFVINLLPKVEHSKKVAQLCRALAGQLHLTKEKIKLAEIIGLLHDVGRFSQFMEYGTFIDSDSIDHGTRGCDVVRKSSIISIVSPGKPMMRLI